MASATELNQQAAQAAESELSTPVKAAAILKRVGMDDFAKAAGVGAGTRGLMKGMNKLSDKMMPGMQNMTSDLEGGGLPEDILLAVTDSEVQALEYKEKGGKLKAGKVVKSFPREGLSTQLQPKNLNALQGVEPDKHLLTINIPLTGAKSKYLKAGAEMAASAGSPGQPIRFQLEDDDASNALIKELNPQGGPAMVISGGNVAMGGQPQDSTAQLEKLAALKESGALTDAEFEAQKAKIIGS
jgi:hypothetical protein